MKLRKVFTILIFVLCLTLCGCEITGLPGLPDSVDENSIVKITYSIDEPSLNQEFELSKFDLNEIKIVAKKGETVIGTFDVNESMINPTDLEKLTAVGEHEIKITYKDFEATIQIKIVDDKNEENPGTDNPGSENPGGDDPGNDTPGDPITDIVTYVDDDGYYKNAVGLKGNDLKLALRKITSTNYHGVSYSSLNNYLQVTDASPTNPNKILLFYLRVEINNSWDGGKTWNKEHVWPRSSGWFQYEAAGCDAHHIRAVDSAENSRRGNKPYGVGSGYYTPKDEVKGDVARILFYLLTRYSESDSYKITVVAQSMKMLLDWNKLDPVDDIERARNEAVYKIQNNRNPFIDYSDYAYYIWDQSYLKVSADDKIEIVIEKIIYFNDLENKKRAIWL